MSITVVATGFEGEKKEAKKEVKSTSAQKISHPAQESVQEKKTVELNDSDENEEISDDDFIDLWDIVKKKRSK